MSKMNETRVCSSSRNTIKTDLSLLLECLKFQMKCPDLQKQALLTIQSICEKREDNVDLLREMGGVTFVYNLSKSSVVNSDVQEAALFTLGTLAEANVYCKYSLCRKETFTHLADWLMKEDISLSLKRVSVYLLFVLVANNKSGQTLAQTTGCLDILLDLFRTTFPFSVGAPDFKEANATETCQLWASVSSALCGCVNNPQNEQAQRICVAAFPILKMWLQQIVLASTEIFQPICFFITMTVANNTAVQESFSASGCLESLAHALVRLSPHASTSLLSCQLSALVTKTLSACITDNSALASSLAQYGVVSHLFSLLASSHLDPEDRLSVLLSLGQYTEASEEHQTQLVQCGGLPLLITLLTEDTSEEVQKVALFILQTCKQATECLGARSLMATQIENVEAPTNMADLKSSAMNLLHRINLLEKRQQETDYDQDETNPLTSSVGQSQPPPPLVIPPPLQRTESIKSIPTLKHVKAGGVSSIKLHTENNNEMKTSRFTLSLQEERAKASRGAVQCSVCRGAGVLMSSHELPLEGGSEPQTAKRQLFKAQLTARNPKNIKCTEKLQDGEEMSKMEKIKAKEPSGSHIRCTGCVLRFEEVTSRNFASLQTSCLHSCDLHKALQETTKKYREHHSNPLLRNEQQDKSTLGYSRFSLTELSGKRYFNKTGKLLPEDRSPPSYKDTETRGRTNTEQLTLHDQKIGTDHSSSRRKRKDFTREEVCYLLSGVKTYGFSWNSILWSYPFQPGRTNVDLAKKYRRLMINQTKDMGCP
ncbi:telomere repeats-binding bouquet formation protein 1 [Parambassis ranga]|uniref:Telomere repeats-binding bouquet formation protein 1 n=1 Tax=Parambassis ranga TaxID=210632 RepID=A0A6P7KE98_9TELE|nr:telomere repeats-binding bouquet formation protein 1 [Parambassis ranga]